MMWGSQSWLQPAFSRPSRLKSRLVGKVACPTMVQGAGEAHPKLIAFRQLIAFLLLAALYVPLAHAGDDVPKIVFTKSFPGSVPAWYSVIVDPTGAAEYREDPKDDNPIKFHLTEADANQIFDLAARLEYFKRKLESPAKVAHMGDKTLHYEKGSQSGETTFNYTEDPDGRTITDWFERISETERHLIDLERVVKYDKLGVNDALLQLEVTLDHKRLVAPEQFLPMLDRVVKNESYIHMARERAANIASQIRNTK